MIWFVSIHKETRIRLTAFPLAISPVGILLDHMLILFLGFWRTFMLPSTMIVLIYITTNSVQRFHFPYNLTSKCYVLSFLIIANLTEVSWYLNVVLIQIYIMISGIEHFLMYLLSICLNILPIVKSFFVYLFFILFCFERQTDREREDWEISSIHLFIHQMPATARASPDWGQEPRTPSGSAHWWQGPK